MKYRISYKFVGKAPQGCKYQAYVYDANNVLLFIRIRDSFAEAKDAAVQVLREQAPLVPPDEEVEI